MKQLNRYDFTNDKSFSTHLLSTNDLYLMKLPECDVIGLQRSDAGRSPLLAMRPDEALILARLLIDAVWQVTEEYGVAESKPARPKFIDQPEDFNTRLHRDGFSGIPIVADSTVPKDEIHLRQDGKTEVVLKVFGERSMS